MASTAPGSSDGSQKHRTPDAAGRGAPAAPSPTPPPSPPSSQGPVGGDHEGMTEIDLGEPVPRTERDAGAWLVFAGLGFVAGQVASAILLYAVAAATGHSSDVAQLAART